MSHLALYLLGPPRIELDGVPIKVDRRKAIALLAYLAVTGESQWRDSPVNLLWPEYDGARGRAALRRTLFALQKALGDDRLKGHAGNPFVRHRVPGLVRHRKGASEDLALTCVAEGNCPTKVAARRCIAEGPVLTDPALLW